MLIDTHAHLYWDSFKEDFDEVIKRSLEAGVSTIINVGVSIETSKAALRQTEDKVAGIPNLAVYSSIGIHPHEAVSYAQFGQKPHDRDAFVYQDIIKLEEIYRSNPDKVVAVGECGLDFLSTSEKSPSAGSTEFTLSPSDKLGVNVAEVLTTSSLGKSKSASEVFIKTKKLQIMLFQAQIDLAKKLNLPLIVHCRDDRSQNPQNCEAWDQVLKMVGSHPAILHCYSGLLHTTNRVLQTANFLVSFAATITYPKNEYLREAARILPLDRIVLETDCPFLPPQSKRGQRNEPSAVKEIAQTIAGLKGISIEKVADQTFANSKKIFNI